MKNIGFAGIDYQWFIGQVPPNQTSDKTSPDGWGDRVKVRIIGMHDKSSTNITDDELPWAIVERPTSQGNGSRGSTGLVGGEWVRGYFLDPFNQVPVITNVLARGTYENNASLQTVIKRKSTEFENITRYNASKPHQGQIISSPKPLEQAQPTKEEFDAVKEIPASQEDIDYNLEKKENSGQKVYGQNSKQTTEMLLDRTDYLSQYGTAVNDTPTAEQLQQFESRGWKFTPNPGGIPGGKVEQPGSLLGG